MDNRLWFDQALRDVTMITKETPWDVARRLGALLVHVVEEQHDPRVCTTCGRAIVYARVLTGALQLPPDTGEGT
jgi:hypothetical protein